MKKIIVLVFVVFFVSTGLVQACELCDGLGKLGYTKFQIAQLIRSSANRAEAETRMRQLITEGSVKVNPRQPVAIEANRPVEVKSQQPRQQTVESVNPQIVTAGNQAFRFSKEVIQVPPDIERR